jgi:HNH endonuclease
MDDLLEVKEFAAERIAAAQFLEFREIPRYPSYYVSNVGHVISAKRTKLRFQKLGVHQGYKRAAVGPHGVHIHPEMVHGLVLEAFVGPRPDGMQCRHKNGIRHDNRVENLAWGTPQENSDDRTQHGTQPVGVKNPRAKLNESQVLEIRASTELYSVLSARYGVAEGMIWFIRKRKNWKHLDE